MSASEIMTYILLLIRNLGGHRASSMGYFSRRWRTRDKQLDDIQRLFYKGHARMSHPSWDTPCSPGAPLNKMSGNMFTERGRAAQEFQHFAAMNERHVHIAHNQLRLMLGNELHAHLAVITRIDTR